MYNLSVTVPSVPLRSKFVSRNFKGNYSDSKISDSALYDVTSGMSLH